MSQIYAITGASGKVGGHVANKLLEKGHKVRVVVRRPEARVEWEAKGAEVVVTELSNSDNLIKAFTGVDGAFILQPQEFGPDPDFASGRAIVASYKRALGETKPKSVVVLSSFGAELDVKSVLYTVHLLETAVRELNINATFLRATGFYENYARNIATVLSTGTLFDFHSPADKTFPSVATVDVGNVAADLLLEKHSGIYIVEVKSDDLSPNDYARAFSNLIGKPVKTIIPPRDQWEAILEKTGVPNPPALIALFDGINDGSINVGKADELRKGTTKLETVLKQLLETAEHQSTHH